MVGGNDIAVSSEPWLFRVECRLSIDQFVEPRDVLLRSHPPDTGWRRRRSEFDTLGKDAEKQIMVDKVAFVRIEVSGKATLVFHHSGKIIDDPIGELEALDDLRLRLLFRRHFAKSYLCPNSFPKRRVGLIDCAKVEQIEIALGRNIVVAFEAMLIEEALREVFEISVDGLAGRVGICSPN